MVQGWNSGRGEIFCIHSDWLWGPPNLLYNGYPVSFLEVKLLGRGVDNPPHLVLRVKEE